MELKITAKSPKNIQGGKKTLLTKVQREKLKEQLELNPQMAESGTLPK